MEPNIAQALQFINANTINSKILANESILTVLLSSSASDAEIASQLTLRSLSRQPTPAELATLKEALIATHGATTDERANLRKQVFADLFWALLSGPEFVFNH